MIAYPNEWQKVGQPIELREIERTIIDVLRDLTENPYLTEDSNIHLALSGGIDSSLMLFYLKLLDSKNIITYTIALDENHPDYKYAKIVAEYFDVEWNVFVPSSTLKAEDGDFPGDEIVRAFFDFVNSKKASSIICCDGIDEYMCGYYAHMENLNEETYYSYIRSLQEEHLIPLNKNSGDVKVHLPYIDNRIINLLSQIPLSEKCDSRDRKKIMLKLAEGKLPDEVINRRKYGFCDAMKIK